MKLTHLILFVAAVTPKLFADDLRNLVSNCGKPYSSETGNDYTKTLEYRLGGDSIVDITLRAPNYAHGPWSFDSAFHFGGDNGLLTKAEDAMPCLKKAGYLTPSPEQTAIVSAPQKHDTETWPALLVIFIMVLYFVPTICAASRNCKAGAGIMILNIFLGWTFLGWVVALIWAAVGEPAPQSRAA